MRMLASSRRPVRPFLGSFLLRYLMPILEEPPPTEASKHTWQSAFILRRFQRTGLTRGCHGGQARAQGEPGKMGDSLENYFSKVGLGDLGTSKGFATALESISPCGCHRTPCGRAILPQNHFPQAPILAHLGPGHLGRSGPGPSWPIWAWAILAHLGPGHLGPSGPGPFGSHFGPDHLGPGPFGPGPFGSHLGPGPSGPSLAHGVQCFFFF